MPPELFEPHLDRFRLILSVGLLAVMLLVETLRPARAWAEPRLRRLGFHLFVSVFNTTFMRLAVVPPLLLWANYVYKNGWGLADIIGLSGWGEVIATFVLFDLLDYWWHRFNHTVGFLWRFHSVHHTDTHVDVTTSLRFHFGELTLSALAKATWILAWGPSMVGFILFEAGITAYSQFHHSNIDLPDPLERALRWVHMTPRLHAGHHAVSGRTRDANYSTVFLVWDRIFRTLIEPTKDELSKLGLSTGRETYLSFPVLLKTPLVRS